MDLTSSKVQVREEEAALFSWGGAPMHNTLTMLVGAPDGSVQKTLAATWKGPVATTASMVVAREGILWLWMDSRDITSRTVSDQPSALGAYAVDGRSLPRRIQAPLGQVA